MHDAWLDLLLGSTCVGCERPGRSLCEPCAASLPRVAAVCWPTPTPAGLALPVATGEYDGLLKVLVNAHKERQRFSLVHPLAETLACAVREVAQLSVPAGGAAAGVLLVPVPSQPRTVRARGHDPMLRVTRVAAAQLRRSGQPVTVSRLLRTRGGVRDQAGLDAGQRAVNLAHSMAGRPGPAARHLVRRPGALVVVTDDVLTTGSTAREAQRALEAVGVRVTGVATVAATRKIVRGSGPETN